MNQIKLVALTLLTSLLLSACGTTQTVPITGRKHRISVSDEQVLSLSQQEYSKFMASATKSTDAKNIAMVQRVGHRLATAVETYLRDNGFAKEINNFQWEFNLIKDKQANAFCMPGGKIVVYDGLLPYTQNETCLAIVLGHEIAHAVAKHSAEQISKQQNQQIGTGILGTVLNSTIGGGVGDIASTVAGQYFSFRNLKYSRDNETEADHMGLIFAAMAGYDPQQAIAFWQRMSKGNSNTNDLLSTHPSDAKRIAALQKEMPEALKYYNNGRGYTATVATTHQQSRQSVNLRDLMK